MVVPLMFLGLVVGPFNTPLWSPMGISPRSLLFGADFFWNTVPRWFDCAFYGLLLL
jgi:hypothetical protein